MNISRKVKANRTFVSKAKYFIKTYPLTNRDPAFIIRNSIENLVKDVEAAHSINDLEALSEVARQMIEHSSPEDLCQFPVTGDYKRFLIYKPCKFTSTEHSHIVDIYDMLYIAEQENNLKNP